MCLSFNNFTRSDFSFFVLLFFGLFFSSPEEVVLHMSNFLYDLVHLAFPREELPVLEVIEHDGNKAHLFVWLECKSKRHHVSFKSKNKSRGIIEIFLILIT